MIYLGLALYAEGPKDYHFLPPLLQRLCDDLCLQGAVEPVDIGGVVALDDAPNVKTQPREIRVIEAARHHQGAWKILFVHTDGAGNAGEARENLAKPALEALDAEFGDMGCCSVAVVPVRETEAWAICDGDAVRQVFGTTLDDRALSLPPTARAAESVADPKAVLAKAFMATNPSTKRQRRGVSPMLSALAECVSLARLRQMTSFLALEEELRVALKGLRVLR